MERDPITTYRTKLLDAGIDEAALDAIDAETTARVDKAEETARNSSPPPLEIAQIDLWSDGSSSWRN